MEDNFKVNLEEVSQSLNEIKKFEVTGHYDSFNKLGFALCVHIRDEYQMEYSLLINHNGNLKNLHTQKMQSKYLKSVNHPNIIQFIDEFTIGQYQFLQTQRIYTCFFDWINDFVHKKPISEIHYVEIALQLMDVTYYVNKNQYALPLKNTLSCFSIDTKMKIKLLRLDIPKPINIKRTRQYFTECNEKNELFYYRKEVLDINDKDKIQQTYNFDIWAIGICLQYLSGISIEQIQSYLQGKQSFIFSESLGFQNNAILQSILYNYQNHQFKPSFSHLIGCLQNQQNKLQNEGQLRDDEESKIQKIKEDFNEYVQIHNLIYTRQLVAIKQLDLDSLMKTYGSFEQILDLESKLLYLNNQIEKGLTHYEEIIEMNPQSDFAFFCIGQFYMLMGQKEKAINYFKQALKLNQFNDGASLNIGNIYVNNKYGPSITYLLQSQVTNPNHSGVYPNLGSAYFNDNQPKKAMYCLKQVTESSKIYSDYSRSKLSNLYSSEEQFEKAICSYKLITDSGYLDDDTIPSFKSQI